MEWADLRSLISEGDAVRVAHATRGLSEPRRRTLAAPTKEYATGLRREWSNSSGAAVDVLRVQAKRNAAAVACAACLQTPATLALELTRATLFCFDHAFDVDDQCPLPTLLSDALLARNVPWLPELVACLAKGLPTSNAERVGGARGVWRLSAELARATGTPPPITDRFVLGWAAGFWLRSDDEAAAMMRGDPWLPLLVPKLFEVDGSGVPFPVLATLAADGTLDRQTLISGCLAGLGRTRNPADVQGIRALLEALEPGLEGPDLDTDRIRDYVALLPAAHRAAAEQAQTELRCLDEAGRLEFGTLVEVSEIVLRRREHKLVRAQLDWLDAAIGRDPSRAADLLRAVAIAFGQQSRELQRRALTVAVRHASRAGDAVLAELAKSATVLSPEFRGRAAKAFGTPAAGADPMVAEQPPVIAAAAMREMPAPIGSPAELAGELAGLYADCTAKRSAGCDPVMAERVLAALVTFAYQDRAALREALRPVLTRHQITPGPRDWGKIGRLVASSSRRRLQELPEGFADLTSTGSGSVEAAELGSIVGAAVGASHGQPGDGYPSMWQVKGEWFWRSAVKVSRLGGPRQAFLRRLHEIAVGLTYAPLPMLVATPTTASGLLDPDELLTRLEHAAADGWQPWPRDLEQALLRLPRGPGGDLARRARRLGTPAGSRLARWLDDGGLPDPTVTSVGLTWENHGCRLATIQPGRTDQTELMAPLTTLDHPERLVYGDHGRSTEYFNTAWLPCWPAMLPAHRDVIAAHVAPQLARRTMHEYATFTRFEPAGRRLLPLLAEADGPTGPGMHLALCYGLTAHELTDRGAAVDALLTLAGRGQLDGTGLGAEFGPLAAAGDVLLNRAVPVLADAARAGAHAQIWDLVAVALPRLLPPATSKPPQRLADLIALGTEVAEIIRPRATIPGLAEAADRGGSARFVIESRRLLKVVAAE